MIYIDLILNLALLVALSIVSGFIDKHWSRPTRLGLLLQGLLFGGASVLGMLHPLNMGPGLIFDGRSIMLSLCALFFGPWAATVASAMAVGCRLAMGGAGTLTGVLVILASAGIGLLVHSRFKREDLPPSTGQLYGFGLVVHLTMLALMFTLPEGTGLTVIKSLGLPVILLYPLATILVGKILSDQFLAFRTLTDLQATKQNLTRQLLERQEAEVNLLVSEDRYRDLVENSQDLICTHDLEGRLLSVNPWAAEVLGYDRDSLLGKNLGDFLVPGTAHQFDEYLKTITAQGSASGLMAILAKTGEQRIWEYQNTLRTGGVAAPIVRGMAHDITKRKRAERALAESERFYRNLFDNHGAVKLMIDSDTGAILDANEAAVNFYGWPREQLKQMKIQEINTLSAEEIREERARAAAEKRVHFEFRHRLADGSIREVEVFSSNIQSKGKVLQHSIVHDITGQKFLAEQLRQSQKMEAIGQLAGGVAHDFNNILSVIMGYGGLLKMGENLNEQQRDRLDQIMAAAEKAAQLTNGLLAFSRKQVMDPKILNLNDLVQNLQKFLVRVIGEDITLTSIFHPGDLPVSVDSGQIEQVLINLTTNARDAMPQGGLLTIETGVQKIDASFVEAQGVGQAGNFAVVSVFDTGCGMSVETQKKIFEPFFTTKETGKGTGLGMAIVYGIVKQHNGFINLYSEPGTGTTFRIYLPLLEQVGFPRKTEPQPAPAFGRGETILVAEDDAAVATLVEKILTGYGYKVILAADGKEAVAHFTAHRDKIGLILMDMIMPKQSGKEAADEIWRQHPGTKILFSSGYTADFLRNRNVDEEEVVLINKPFQPLELLGRLRLMLDG